jgi:hypothetical protein
MLALSAKRLVVVRNAVEVVFETRALSHGELTRSEKAAIVDKAFSLAGRSPQLPVTALSAALLKWLNEETGRQPRRRANGH